MAKITKDFEDIKNPYDIHDEIIKKIYKITGQKTPITIQTKDGKLIKVEVIATSKKNEIDDYLETLKVSSSKA